MQAISHSYHAIASQKKSVVSPWVWFWALLYFFLNTWLLPLGLLYTTLLTPVFIVYLHQHRALQHCIPFLVFSIPFALVHAAKGVDVTVYFISWSLLFSVYVFACALWQFLKHNNLGVVFRWMLTANFFLLLAALLLRFALPDTLDVFWYQNKITTGAAESIRYKGFTYEASYYALLFAPVFLYYILRLLLTQVVYKWWMLLLVIAPLVSSLSFGVIAALLVAVVVALCADVQAFVRAGRYLRWLLLTLVMGFLLCVVLLRWFPDGAVAMRLVNILQGQDPSFSGRTTDAFYLAWKIAQQKSIWWGAGFGQVKILGPEIFQQFYYWPSPTSHAVALPNSMADLLAQAGLIGVLLKLLVCGYFFFKTAVYNNVYRLALFAFIFIYQFTGSFINSIAEFSIWVLAFAPYLFPIFNRMQLALGVWDKNRFL